MTPFWIPSLLFSKHHPLAFGNLIAVCTLFGDASLTEHSNFSQEQDASKHQSIPGRIGSALI